MKNKYWFKAGTKWWYFWRPQSGLEGGFIMGLVLCIILFIIMKVLGYE